MAFTRKQYKGNVAYTVTLAGGISAADTTITISDGTTFPDGSVGPFVVTVDQGAATEEKILIATRTSNSLAVAASGRGYDNTTAQAHSNGATIKHTIDAVSMDEANQAVVNTIGKVTTAGDLLYATGANALARLGVGTEGQLMAVSSGLPAWVTNLVHQLTIVLGSTRVFTVNDGTNDRVNVNNTTHYFELVNGTFLRQYSDAYTTVTFMVDNTGAVTTAQSVSPGNAGLAGTASHLWSGTGVPPVGLGTNGDYYLRADGGAGATHLYFKSGGAWAGVV